MTPEASASMILVTEGTGPGVDDGSDREAVAVLETAGARVDTVATAEGGGVPSIPADADCIVCPYELSGTDGITVLETVRGRGNETPFVLYARDGDESVASAAIGAGATDYVPVDAGISEVVADRALAAVRDSASGRTATSERSAGSEPTATSERSAGSEPTATSDRTKASDGTEGGARERSLSDAYAVIADGDRSFHEQVTDLLAVVQDALGTEYATLSYVDGDEYTFEGVGAPAGDPLAPGDTTSLSETNCERVIETERTVVLEDIERDAPELAGRPGNAERGISCYVGAPVMVDGESYGTFCFYDRASREEAFSEWQVTFVDLFSDWVGSELERQQYVNRLAALNDLHSVVRTVTDAVMHRSERDAIEGAALDGIAGTASYSLAWIDAESDDGFETTAVGPSDGVDQPVAVGDEETAWGDADASLRAHRDGRMVVVDVGRSDGTSPVREAALAGAGFERWVAIPIASEDECFGILNVSTVRRDGLANRELSVLEDLGEILGLAIATVERKRTLAHERERLEFVNRFIRHNLLNSLNVVEARTGMLDAHVDDAGHEHLDVVQERTGDMVGLIETLRALMQAFSADATRQTEPVDLGEVVREEVEAARAAFEAASFRTSLPESTVTVLADDLLTEVFRNLLVNAVQHNDNAVPTVAVTVTATDETATVHVRDDGPGIAETVLPSVFEKGERVFESPGTGFGLYLVREIVDAYDGEVAVESERGEGTTFSVTLPRV